MTSPLKSQKPKNNFHLNYKSAMLWNLHMGPMYDLEEKKAGESD